MGGITISAFDKLNDRVRSIPSDLTIDEADCFLRHYGYTRARQKGSHCLFRKPDAHTINIQGPIVKEYQIKQMLNAVDSIF